MKKAGADEIVSPTLPGGMRIAPGDDPGLTSFPSSTNAQVGKNLRVEGNRAGGLHPQAPGFAPLRSADYVLIAVCERTAPGTSIRPRISS